MIQLAATAEEMSGQAEQLRHLMNFFKVTEDRRQTPTLRDGATVPGTQWRWVAFGESTLWGLSALTSDAV
jgi:hypothetical protein